MIGLARSSRIYRPLAILMVTVMVLGGLVMVWLPGAGAQDGTDFAGTAVAEFTPTPYVEPTPTPSPPPINFDAPEFMDGTFRIVVQRASWAREIEELQLNARTGRDWIAVVVDVVNFSDIATSVTPSDFAIRSLGNSNGGFAKTTTEQVAGRLGIEPGDVDAATLLQAGQSIRFALVFQVDEGIREPALVYQTNAVPLESRSDQNLGFSDLPAVATEPELQNAILGTVIDGNSVQLTGDISGDFDLAGVDAPVNDECYAAEAKTRLESILGGTVLVEQPGNDQAGIYLWYPLPNGTRVLVNQDMVITGTAASNASPGGRFSDWLIDSEFVARHRTSGLWGRCTSQHGVSRPNTIENNTFETVIDGEDTGPYIPWVDWTPLILSLPNGGAISFYSAEAEPENPATPTPSEVLVRKLYYSVYDPAQGSWSEAEALPDGGRLQFGISGAVDSQGRVHIVYSDRKADTPAAVSTLKYMVREVNGAWSRPENVAPNSLAGHQLSPSLTIDAADTLHVVWQDQRLFNEETRRQSPSIADAFYATKPAGSGWSAPISINKHSNTSLVSRPQIAIDGNRAVATWSVYALNNLSSANRIEWSYLSLDAGSTWATPINMIAGRGEAFGGRLVDLKADPTGGVIFVFGRQSTDTFLFMRRLAPMGTEWGTDILLTFGDRGTFPSLTVAEDGTAYVVYNLGFGADVNVAGVAVPANSIVPGPEVILTNGQEGSHGRASVTTDLTGLPWVIYFSQPEGGTPNAVSAIRNFIIPRSAAELQALLDAASTPQATATTAP